MDDQVQLCSVVEGVQFTVHSGERAVKGLILRETLEALYGAGESPQSWLRAYALHAQMIHAAALLQHRQQPESALVVLRPAHASRVGASQEGSC